MFAVCYKALVTAAALAATASPAPAAAPAAGARVSPYAAAVHISRDIGSRPAGGGGEARAHAYVAQRFRAAGLAVERSGFAVPGRGRSENTLGVLDMPRDCLTILMAHTDSVPPGRGADDNGSGLGELVALAPRLASLNPQCDVWLVATGAEERDVIGTSYHVGAQALVDLVRSRERTADLRFALSLDMLGRGSRFYLRSPQPSVRPGVEGTILAASRKAGVTVRWARDEDTGNSDHREFELAGLPGAVLEVWKGIEACHHAACDRWPRLQKAALNRVQRIAVEIVRDTR
jgi:hypothetical protein